MLVVKGWRRRPTTRRACAWGCCRGRFCRPRAWPPSPSAWRAWPRGCPTTPRWLPRSPTRCATVGNDVGVLQLCIFILFYFILLCIATMAGIRKAQTDLEVQSEQRIYDEVREGLQCKKIVCVCFFLLTEHGPVRTRYTRGFCDKFPWLARFSTGISKAGFWCHCPAHFHYNFFFSIIHIRFSPQAQLPAPGGLRFSLPSGISHEFSLNSANYWLKMLMVWSTGKLEHTEQQAPTADAGATSTTTLTN